RAAASPTISFSGKYSLRTSPGSAGLCMRDIAHLSMVVDVIHCDRVRAFEPKHQSPVPTDLHQPSLHSSTQPQGDTVGTVTRPRGPVAPQNCSGLTLVCPP